jgi:hypothetical protein
MKQNLEEQIPQLFAEVVGTSFTHGVRHFKGFLSEIFQKAFVRLFPVPGATRRPPVDEPSEKPID